MNISQITATVEPKGAKFVHRVYQDGELIDTRTSARRFTVINVQVWPGTDGWAARYGTKAIAAGRKIEYGTSAGSVAIEEVAA